jgi:hypothetical protein
MYFSEGNHMSEAFACGKEPRKGKDFKTSLELQLLEYMQTCPQRVYTLRNFIFTNRYLSWVKRQFGHELAQLDFEAALRDLYCEDWIQPIAYKEGSRNRNYDPKVILDHVEEFAITCAGQRYLQRAI